MKEIRFHGKGGQGVIRSAQLIVQTVVEEGLFAHFIPSFGVERKGSPVHGFLRLDNKDIRLKSQVYEPEAVVILDDSLLNLPLTFAGLKPNSTVIINSAKSLDELELPDEAAYVYTVDATNIALDIIKVDIPNTVILGAYAKVIGELNWNTLLKNIEVAFGESNKKAAIAGYDNVKCIKTKE
jgi:2-oxoacid:acceptor oxidoreductase gamma subunit (pyruvate/2-ketoisovalerate family)